MCTTFQEASPPLHSRPWLTKLHPGEGERRQTKGENHCSELVSRPSQLLITTLLPSCWPSWGVGPFGFSALSPEYAKDSPCLQNFPVPSGVPELAVPYPRWGQEESRSPLLAHVLFNWTRLWWPQFIETRQDTSIKLRLTMSTYSRWLRVLHWSNKKCTQTFTIIMCQLCICPYTPQAFI